MKVREERFGVALHQVASIVPPPLNPIDFDHSLRDPMSARRRCRMPPRFTYSRALRHLHLIMAVGIFGAVGTAQAAQHCEGQTKKQLLWWHKQILDGQSTHCPVIFVSGI